MELVAAKQWDVHDREKTLKTATPTAACRPSPLPWNPQLGLLGAALDKEHVRHSIFCTAQHQGHTPPGQPHHTHKHWGWPGTDCPALEYENSDTTNEKH